MTTFRTVPVDEALRVIQTWAHLDRPITHGQALGVRDHLGWTSATRNEGLLTTHLGFGPDDCTISFSDGLLANIDFDLSELAPPDASPEVTTRCRAAHQAYLDALTALYGTPEDWGEHRGFTSHHWTLPNQAEITLTGGGRLIGIGITSPEWAEIERIVEESGFWDHEPGEPWDQ